MEYYVDFSGYLLVEADNSVDAEVKMWEFIRGITLPHGFSDDVWEIDGIEMHYGVAELLENGAHIVSQGDEEIAIYPPEN